jgi:hypothetical protein
MLDKQIRFYRKNKPQFEEMYNGKYIIIKNMQVLGVYETHSEAYYEAIKNNDIGSFIIEHPVRKKRNETAL